MVGAQIKVFFFLLPSSLYNSVLPFLLSLQLPVFKPVPRICSYGRPFQIIKKLVLRSFLFNSGVNKKVLVVGLKGKILRIRYEGLEMKPGMEIVAVLTIYIYSKFSYKYRMLYKQISTSNLQAANHYSEVLICQEL